MAIRDIIFRGKRMDNGEWVEGYLIKQDSPEYHCYIVVSFKAEQDNRHTDILECDIFEIDPETVGQYTGLTDKNGKKIFEGDIVKIDGYEKVYEVKYMLGQFFVGINMPIAYKRFDCEVIGNIHDNPELLEVAK